MSCLQFTCWHMKQQAALFRYLSIYKYKQVDELPHGVIIFPKMHLNEMILSMNRTLQETILQTILNVSNQLWLLDTLSGGVKLLEFIHCSNLFDSVDLQLVLGEMVTIIPTQNKENISERTNKIQKQINETLNKKLQINFVRLSWVSG